MSVDLVRTVIPAQTFNRKIDYHGNVVTQKKKKKKKRNLKKKKLLLIYSRTKSIPNRYTDC